MLRWFKRSGRYGFEIIESVFNAAFGNRWNPFYHLGGLAFLCFWIIAFTGLYLYIFFETSITGAYESVQRLTVEQWYLGGVMRSLHRYASDAMVVIAAIHILREFTRDRYRGIRWYSWFTGIPLVWLMYASGIGGYWLVWDQLAQYIAISTAEWMDWLPMFSEPMASNFLNEATLSDRFFSLLSFLHIGIPLTMLLAMWIHIQRLSNPDTNPPKGLAIGTLLALLVLSLIKPAVSHAPANLDQSVTVLNLDWFYMYMYPLLDAWSPMLLWLLLGGISILMTLMPWLPPEKRAPVARVDLANCNGCGLCFTDCPYDAVVMKPRSDGLPYKEEAMVEPGLCASCGICVGACPTSTPFRRTTEFIPGIDMPAATVHDLREKLLEASGHLSGDARVMVFTCQHGQDIEALRSKDTAVFQLPCISALPPPFLDFILSRKHADGVLLTGCREGSCYHRYGVEWMEQRLAGERDPRLRKRVPREYIAQCWEGGARLQRELDRLRDVIRKTRQNNVVSIHNPGFRS